jgi:hypothetical protein
MSIIKFHGRALRVGVDYENLRFPTASEIADLLGGAPNIKPLVGARRVRVNTTPQLGRACRLLRRPSAATSTIWISQPGTDV